MKALADLRNYLSILFKIIISFDTRSTVFHMRKHSVQWIW